MAVQDPDARGRSRGDADAVGGAYAVEHKRINGKPVTILTGCTRLPGGHTHMIYRLTNNSEIDEGAIASVFVVPSGGFRIVFKDGTAKTVRRAMLHHEGLALLTRLAAGG